MSIEVKEVSKYYGDQAALKNVSFTAEKGEVLGFLGPNGAGKSTMMKILTCFLPPNKGDVKVAGFDIYDQSIAVRKKVGYLPETNPLYPEMYIREYLRFAAGMYGVKNKKAKVDEMIERVGLELESHKRIGELSKGYKQRVGIAQALIHDPEVLILDEPTSGLDPNQLDDIRKLIRTIGKQKTVLLSTHIMQEVESVCNRVIIIKRGEIVADSSVSELKAEANTEETRLHLSKEISLRKIQALPSVTDVKAVGKGQYSILHQKGQSLGPALTALAAAENAEVEELKKVERSLEDVFKTLTK